MKKYLSVVLTLALILSLAAFAMPTAFAADDDDFHIGIITGSVSQSEDDRRGAEAFQAMYGEDMVKLAIYPDNFTEELETTIQTIVNMSDDPARAMRTCPRSAVLPTWSATTTSLPAAI